MASEKIGTKTVTGRIPLDDYQELRGFSAREGVSLASLMENLLIGLARTLRSSRSGEGKGKSAAWAYSDVDPKALEEIRQE